MGGVDWSPDGKQLALTAWRGISSYVFTLDLERGTGRQWSGQEATFFDKGTVSLPRWFKDGEHLLVSVWGKAYEQQFERGIYVIDTRTGDITGPLSVLMQRAFLGNDELYVVGKKYVYEDDARDGNFARYDTEADTWSWLTDFSEDELRFVDAAVPNTRGTEVVLSNLVDNAQQLFMMQSDGSNSKQITELGGENVHWHYDGSGFVFVRDVHKGEGAPYVPFVYDLAAGQAVPLWPNLPDSVPAFPALSTQVPISWFDEHAEVTKLSP